MGALLELVARDPEGDDAELVQGAYQLLLKVSKVGVTPWLGMLALGCCMLAQAFSGLQ
jgi:hypothetical protein